MSQSLEPNPGLQPLLSAAVGRQRLSSEALRNLTHTFAGVKAGSEIRVFDDALNEIAGIESCAANQALSVPYYGGGTNITLEILALDYDEVRITIPAPSVNTSIPIQQRADRWYSNP
jgi:hypothetical protein